MVNHYLLGEDYPAFDLLYWNGDVTNLPAKWHAAYLQDLYRDNKLVQADTLSADGTLIDLRLVATPAYVQAGREDHIAPPESVWRLTEHLAGPVRFVLAGSGHIAGVVNPPAARKYQHWTNEKAAASLKAFLAGAEEHPGSWWTDWIAWLGAQDGAIALVADELPVLLQAVVLHDAALGAREQVAQLLTITAARNGLTVHDVAVTASGVRAKPPSNRSLHRM